MVKTFAECEAEGLVKRELPDINEAHALMDKAEKRLKYLLLRPVDEEFAELAFENAYEAMREAGVALMSVGGYKPLSHEAVIAYLAEKEDISYANIAALDRFRRLRNTSMYEAQKIPASRAKEAVEFAQKIVGMLNGKLRV